MNGIFEEYGKSIVIVIVSAILFVTIFSGLNLLGVLGNEADIETDISHIEGEGALKDITDRAKPSIYIPDEMSDSLIIYRNIAFQPLKNIVCKDADGATLSPTITSILFKDHEGNKTEFISNYNSTADIVILNFSHYKDTHKLCSADELNISNEADYHNCGTVIVTYKATDSYNITTVKSIAFVIDNKVFKE